MKVHLMLVGILLATAVDLFAQPAPDKAAIFEILKQLSPEIAGEEALLPAGFKLDRLQANDQQLKLQLSLAQDFLDNQLDEDLHEELIEQVVARTAFGYASVSIEAKGKDGLYQPLSHFLETYDLPIVTQESNGDPLPFTKGEYRRVPRSNGIQPTGALSGKTVWLSAGHGWKYDKRHHNIRTQRSNHHGIVEDFATAEMVNYYLLKYLYQAGANVWTVRERDMNPKEIIVSNEDRRAGYKETGHWQTSSSKGYKESSYRYAISGRKTSATATFQPLISEAGLYWISVHYRSGLNRSIDARYEVHHAGGLAQVSINQEVHGSTWVYLGQFYLEKGQQSKVVLINESSEQGQAIIADAVRFGGGMGNGTECQPQAKSGEPRFEAAASLYSSFQGFPKCLNDVTVRPAYAEWELAKGNRKERENAIYLSLHTNANGGRGTESFVHSYKAIKGSWSLQHYIHQEVIKGIREDYDPQWKNRGRKAADFGELRGLKTMPGVLLEVAFHDHPQDAKALKDPEFRRVVSRAVYRGVVRYFANKSGKQPLYLPEPPTHLHAQSQDAHSIKVSWKPAKEGSRIRHYKVYQSDHGKAFANGIKSTSTNYTFKGLQPGKIYFFRVSAVNEGGESFPTATVAVKTPEKGREGYRYLMVDGYDRLDGSLAPVVVEKQPRHAPLGATRRLLLEQMNNYDYINEHAQAFDKSGLAFDGATNEVVADQLVSLSAYDGVNWYLGRESVEDETLSRKEQQLLKRYLDKGGNLIISGSELAYDLDGKQNGRDFYQRYLKAVYKGDNARSGVAHSAVAFDPMRMLIKNNRFGAYQLSSPDYIYPTAGSDAVLKYGNGKIAGVIYRGEYGLLNLGFPLETIGEAEDRSDLIRQALNYLHHGHKSADFITYVPARFSEEMSIDLSNMTEGRVVFRLHSTKGEKVFEQSWAHYGNRIRTLHLSDLPFEQYEYSLEISGKRQKGYTTRVSLKE